MNINQDLVPENISKELQQIGYGGDYWFVSNEYGVVHHVISSSFDGDYVKHDKFDDRLPRPIFFQAFRWFREKYGLFIRSDFDVNYLDKLDEFQTTYFFSILKMEESLVGFKPLGRLNNEKSYEEAQLTCLRKLIEIVKKKENDTD